MVSGAFLFHEFDNEFLNSLQFRCPLCSESLPTSIALEQHVNRDHADILSPMSNKAKGASTSTANSTAGAKKRTLPDDDDDANNVNGNEEQVNGDANSTQLMSEIHIQS